MGTRALIHVKKDDKDSDTLVTIYRQYDGYPTGLGDDIKSILGGKKVVNGYQDASKEVNGMGCAAAMLIAGLKDGCGNVYIKPVDTEDVWEEYTYTLWDDNGALHIQCKGYQEYEGALDKFDGEEVEAQTADEDA